MDYIDIFLSFPSPTRSDRENRKKTLSSSSFN